MIRVLVSAGVVVSTLGLGLVACGGSSSDSEATDTAASTASPDGTSADAPANFAKVRTGLYRGGHPSYDNLAYLKKLGVKTVVDLEIADYVEATPEEIQQELDDAKLLGLTVVREPMSAFEPFVNQQQMNATLAALATTEPADAGVDAAALGDDGAKPKASVYVHCRHGQDRTGLVVGLERVFIEGWEPADAYAEMLAYGFHTYFLGLKDYFFEQTGYDGG
jgi:protein tyrosine/serine phosphatase